MPSGVFTLKQQELAIGQGAWQNPSFQSSFGAKFNGAGSGQYLTGPTTSALNFGTGNFTVEFWAYINAYGGANLTVAFSASNGGSDFQLSFNAGSQYVYWHNSGIQIAANSAASFTPGRWAHIALVRSGTTVGLFCNGTRYGTATNSASINLTNFNIGSYWASVTSYMVDGWVSNLRITNTAVYDPTASSLTLPLGPLTAISGTQLLTLQNATIVDNSANALTITNNGSVPMQVVYPFGGLAPYKTLAVDYLVVAGGGSGGSAQAGSGTGGGGGAGGLLQGSIPITAGTSYTVTVGAGGAVQSTNSGLQGNTGANSVFGAITSSGGGGGGGSVNNTTAVGVSGGSGGGAGRQAAGVFGGQGVANQGNAGGSSVYVANAYGCGGGGGAGTVGLNGTGSNGGNGGAGVASDISGTRTAYAGGGGGGAYNGATVGSGGAGGGGAGSSLTSVVAGSGTANTGGGGGGGGATAGNGDGGAGAGGSGIVIISYPDTYAPAVATTGAPVASTSGSGSIFYNNPSVSTYTYMSDNDSFNYGSGNFCVECWVYASSSLTTNYIVSQYLSANKGILLGVGATSSGKLSFYYSKTGSDDFQLDDPNAFPTSQWVHVAACRTGNTISLFVAGTRVATRTETGTLYNSTSTIGIGTHIQSLGSNLWPGYITNLRSVAGSNPYDATASTLTVPTAPLARITNTAFLLSAVSGSFLADGSGNNYTLTTVGTPAWNQLSPFATGLGYKNRVYTWTSSGSITF